MRAEPTIDNMIHHIVINGWTYHLTSVDQTEGPGAFHDANHSVTISDGMGQSISCKGQTPAEALEHGIAGFEAMRNRFMPVRPNMIGRKRTARANANA